MTENDRRYLGKILAHWLIKGEILINRILKGHLFVGKEKEKILFRKPLWIVLEATKVHVSNCCRGETWDHHRD